jgi:hypothetical protein
MGADVGYHHRDTLDKIFSHASSGNIEWRKVVSLLDAVGSTRRSHNGKLEVSLGPETEVFQPPSGKDIGEQTLVDLRRMLANAGYGPGGSGGERGATS